MTTPRLRRFAVLAAALVCLAIPAARAEERVFKFATLAPDGSSWMKIIREWAVSVEKRIPGVKFRFFAGGVAGDERDVVRKMRLGQLDGAAVTAVGLGLIQPQVRAFEQPFVFASTAEMDKVRGALDAEVRKMFEDKGYILVAWGDVGPVHLFTNIEIKSMDDLPKMKMWQWTDDPIIRTYFPELGINGVNLGVPDVLPSLQTGLIDACYGSPLSTLALQWNTKVKYMTDMVVQQAIGAVVFTQAAWDKLTPAERTIVREESATLQTRLRDIVRDQDNRRALQRMQALGLKVVETPPDVKAEFEKRSHVAAEKLDGQLWTKDFRLKVQKLIAEARSGALK